MNFEETNFMENEYIKAVKRSYNGGKSKFATVMDLICFNIFRFIASYLLLMQGIRARPLRILLAGVITTVIAIISNMISNNRFDKYEIQLRTDTKNALIKRKLLCMNENELLQRSEAILKDNCYIMQSAKEMEETDLYIAVREMAKKDIESFTIFSLSGFSKDAEHIREISFPLNVRFKSINDLPQLTEGIQISSDDIDNEILSSFRMEPRKHYNLHEAFFSNRTGKYFMLGLILFVLSFFVRYSIYMRSASGILFAFAGACVIINERTRIHK